MRHCMYFSPTSRNGVVRKKKELVLLRALVRTFFLLNIHILYLLSALVMGRSVSFQSFGVFPFFTPISHLPLAVNNEK